METSQLVSCQLFTSLAAAALMLPGLRPVLSKKSCSRRALLDALAACRRSRRSCSAQLYTSRAQ
jgi:hypothetical protein